MTSIFFVIVRICRNQFKCYYVKTKKLFLNFFCAAFLKFTFNSKYFETTDDPHSFCISELRTAKEVVRQMSKKPRFRMPFDSQNVKGSQTLVKSA